MFREKEAGALPGVLIPVSGAGHVVNGSAAAMFALLLWRVCGLPVRRCLAAGMAFAAALTVARWV